MSFREYLNWTPSVYEIEKKIVFKLLLFKPDQVWNEQNNGALGLSVSHGNGVY